MICVFCIDREAGPGRVTMTVEDHGFGLFRRNMPICEACIEQLFFSDDEEHEYE